MDYRKLLIKYMALIIEQEGTNHLNRATVYNWEADVDELQQGLTEADLQELHSLSEVAEYMKNGLDVSNSVIDSGRSLPPVSQQ